MATYIAWARKEDGTAYGVDFPDFPGCISAGDTLDEAVANAREALEFHIQGMLEDGEEVPAPRSLEDVSELDDAKGATPVLISVPVERPNRRVNITMDEGLLEVVDAAAATRGMTRSGFLAQGARVLLERGRPMDELLRLLSPPARWDLPVRLYVKRHGRSADLAEAQRQSRVPHYCVDVGTAAATVSLSELYSLESWMLRNEIEVDRSGLHELPMNYSR